MWRAMGAFVRFTGTEGDKLTERHVASLPTGRSRTEKRIADGMWSVLVLMGQRPSEES